MRPSWEGSVTALCETVVSSERILLLVFLQWARDIILVSSAAHVLPHRRSEVRPARRGQVNEPVAVHGRDFDRPGRRRAYVIAQSVSVAPA